ncbi:hypothetical protein [Flavihumibacter sp. UBA7668]|uniref:hypothetical protein n=1 Tax=Flavihumibacter sp. UBA7668 TaxID=1946542 RepID=UPI0025BABBC1|nr:hypothetical protein [Flavihumibacter sp. UBA7668]
MKQKNYQIDDLTDAIFKGNPAAPSLYNLLKTGIQIESKMLNSLKKKPNGNSS